MIIWCVIYVALWYLVFGCLLGGLGGRLGVFLVSFWGSFGSRGVLGGSFGGRLRVVGGSWGLLGTLSWWALKALEGFFGTLRTP